MKNTVMDCMNYFRSTKAVIYDKKTGGGYDDEAEFIKIKEILCDVQPFGGSLKSDEHSMTASESVKVFCAADSDIKAGRYLEADGALYVITAVKRWSGDYEIIAERSGAYED